jgi:hypothetical protein
MYIQSSFAGSIRRRETEANVAHHGLCVHRRRGVRQSEFCSGSAHDFDTLSLIQFKVGATLSQLNKSSESGCALLSHSTVTPRAMASCHFSSLTLCFAEGAS